MLLVPVTVSTSLRSQGGNSKLAQPSSDNVEAVPTSSHVVPSSGDICSLTVAESHVPEAAIEPTPPIQLTLDELAVAVAASSTFVKLLFAILGSSYNFFNLLDGYYHSHKKYDVENRMNQNSENNRQT
tara:strand:- start:887 stop:1270 length:384 start_codon:yes stop_codon:yes gene_type:complete